MKREYDKQSFQEKAVDPKGCGAETENACFALTIMEGEYRCGLVDAPAVASMAGRLLGWRVNIDEEDELAWCPLGLLKYSKKI